MYLLTLIKSSIPPVLYKTTALNLVLFLGKIFLILIKFRINNKLKKLYISFLTNIGINNLLIMIKNFSLILCNFIFKLINYFFFKIKFSTFSKIKCPKKMCAS